MTSSPVSQRGHLTYQSVVETARAHVIESGMRELSLRRVAADLGVTAPALYAYVSDKNALITGVAELELTNLVEIFDKVRGRDPISRIRRLSKAYIDYALQNPRLFEVMFSALPASSIFARTGAESEAATKAFNYGIDDVTAAVDAGLFRTDIDADMIMFTVWTATHGLANVLLLGFALDRRKQEKLIDSILDTVLAGLAPPSDR